MTTDIIDLEVMSSPSGKEILEKTRTDLNTFSDLLDSLDSIDDRLKLLWKQIYENALTDRRNAYIVWTDLYIAIHGNPEQHVIHGDNLVKLMERMTRSNDQILKLADLVYKAKDKQEEAEIPSSKEIFERLNRKQ